MASCASGSSLFTDIELQDLKKYIDINDIFFCTHINLIKIEIKLYLIQSVCVLSTWIKLFIIKDFGDCLICCVHIGTESCLV